jgi:AbiTii-like protein
MRESLVIELQRLAMDSNTPISELLLRAKTVAAKLNLSDPLKWIEHEINGYPPNAEIPLYRHIPSEMRVQNPFHGWQPVVWTEDVEPLQKHFASADIRIPIAQAEEHSRAKGAIHASLAPAEINLLLNLGNHTLGRLPSARVFSRADFVGILGGVRAKILDWAITLERKTFSVKA